MKRNVFRTFAVVAALMFLSLTVLETTAHARGGGGRSMGSRGSRSFSRQAAPPSYQPGPSRPQMAPSPSPFQQPGGGSFLRSMAGGIAGGLLGGMLFRSLGMAGTGMGGGGGIGLFEILLLAGIGYMIYRFVKKRREMAPVLVRQGFQEPRGYQDQGYQAPYQGTGSTVSAPYPATDPAADVAAGVSHIRQMDYSFDERVFKDQVMDLFFKLQGGWMNRDMAALSPLLTDEMRGIFQEDVNRMLRDRQVNRLENIAVRSVELTEVWQEAGQDYITTLIYANLLDYTTDDATGAVVAGSKTEPVKFEEYWTFTRPVGDNPWRLAAIGQK